MEIGIFLMPAHPPERSLFDATQWDLDIIELADQLGYVEAWVGEHFTVPWGPICAPDLLLAQALMRTKSIKLAPGAHFLPYHHPVELAHRVAYFDHLARAGSCWVWVPAASLATGRFSMWTGRTASIAR